MSLPIQYISKNSLNKPTPPVYGKYPQDTPSGLAPPVYVTNTYRTDGIGSIYITIIYSIIYANYHNLPFKYTPLGSVEHNYNNDPDFIQRMENLMNIKNNFPLIKDDDLVFLNHLGVSRDFVEQNIDELYQKGYFDPIIDLFWKNKTLPYTKNPNEINVAVHIRRPNSHDNRTEGSDTDDKYYINMIRKIKKDHIKLQDEARKVGSADFKVKKLIFTIYSQGDIRNFDIYIKEFGPDSIKLKIDYNIEKTFTEFVYSDILVTSRSMLSYVAALFNKGEIYYQRFSHVPLSHWKIFHKNDIRETLGVVILESNYIRPDTLKNFSSYNCNIIYSQYHKIDERLLSGLLDTYDKVLITTNDHVNNKVLASFTYHHHHDIEGGNIFNFIDRRSDVIRKGLESRVLSFNTLGFYKNITGPVKYFDFMREANCGIYVKTDNSSASGGLTDNSSATGGLTDNSSASGGLINNTAKLLIHKSALDLFDKIILVNFTIIS